MSTTSFRKPGLQFIAPVLRLWLQYIGIGFQRGARKEPRRADPECRAMAYDHPRDFHGYGARPPDPKWPGGARIALQIVMNYDEGSEDALGEGAAGSETYPTQGPRSPLVPAKP